MRSIAQIYAEVVAYKDSQNFGSQLLPVADNEADLLDALQSGSKVAIWRLWAYVVAAAIYAHEAIFELFRKEVDDAANAANVGTARWYRDRVLEFQYGDELAYDLTTGRYRYLTIDATKRIVKQCAVVEGNNGLVLFKVATADAQETFGLDFDQKEALESFLMRIRFAGTRFTIITGDGDFLRIEANVYYDATRTLGTVKAAVEKNIRDYVERLPFNGEFLVTKLVDAIQVATGVNDVLIDEVNTRTDILQPFAAIERVHVPVYGFYQLDYNNLGELDTINYIPQ